MQQERRKNSTESGTSGSRRQTRPINGRGAQSNPAHRFQTQELQSDLTEGIDEQAQIDSPTQFLEDYPKKVINRVDSPDIGMSWSVNPYQGCEHGCVYCYARNTHSYWGYSAGLDFERKIVVKPQVADLVEKAFQKPNWEPLPLMLSGNTDCYQPAERKYKLTRKILEVCLRYQHPVGIITKNALVLRDIDLLRELASMNLLRVNLSITTLNEGLRRKLEPRTVPGKRRLQVVEKLSAQGIPVHVMAAPMIPGLNSEEIPEIVRRAADVGALSCAYILVRLNGEVAGLFEEWLGRQFPERKDKVLSLIRQCRGGNLGEHRFGIRMRGEGPVALSIKALFQSAWRQHFQDRSMPAFDTSRFIRRSGEQLGLFCS